MELIAIITKHGKEKIIGPILQEKLNIPFEHIYFNTDLFGTFTNEKPRKDILTALSRKVRVASQLSKANIIVASEGSFYPHPYIFGLHVNTEHLIYYNKQTNQEIVVYENFSKLVFDKQVIKSIPELNMFLEKNKFPNHKVIVEIPRFIIRNKYIKDINCKKELEAIITKHKKVTLHTDQRADRNPTRSENIKKLTYKLLEQLQL
jgi:hypothetical protein